MNYKRVERLYRLEGLAVRTRHRKRLAVPSVPRPPALAPNDTWGIDFVSDTLSQGRRFRAFTVVDVCTHECLAITVAHGLPSAAVIATLQRVIADRGAPVRLSLNNGSEFRSRAFDAWAADAHIELAFIQPGKPVQNAHIESFNGRLRDECLNSHWFLSLADARFHIERFRQSYNTDRPARACWPLTPCGYLRPFTHSTVCLNAESQRGDRQFGELTRKQLKRGAHRSTDALEHAIMTYIAHTNDDPKPFVWTKTADEILDSVKRFCQRTSGSPH